MTNMDTNKFQFSPGRKTLLVIASVIIIFNYCFLGLSIFQTVELNYFVENIQIILFAIPYCFILLTLRLYFKFYELHLLTKITSLIVIGELLGSFLDIIKTTLTIPQFLTLSVNVLTFILIFVWAYCLTRIDKTAHKERTSLYRHGYAIFITFFFALVIIFNVSYQGNLTLFNTQNLLFAIPYLFIIDFVLKLNKPTNIPETAST